MTGSSTSDDSVTASWSLTKERSFVQCDPTKLLLCSFLGVAAPPVLGCGSSAGGLGGIGGSDGAGGRGGFDDTSPFVAVQLTEDNAEELLFGGTDASGGIGDWYLSNGVVELIVDDARPQDDLVPLLGDEAPPRQNHVTVSGGNPVDIGLVGRDNDQLPAFFHGTGLSSRNLILNHSVSATISESSATIEVVGAPTNLEVAPEDAPIVTTYALFGSSSYVDITTRITNNGDAPVPELGIVRDSFFWARRAIIPFSPIPDRGFSHVRLDLDNIVAALETVPFSVGPGSVSPSDGIMDPNTGRPAGEVSYGLLGVDVSLDPDGDGPVDPVVREVNTILGVSSAIATSFGNPTLGSVPPGGVMTYRRRMYIGDRNDVASVANPMITELARRQGFGVGTIGLDPASAGPGVLAGVVATRTGGSEDVPFEVGAPVSQFYTSENGDFDGIVLPEGTYALEFRAAERDPITVEGVVVRPDEQTNVMVSALSDVGAVTVELVELVDGVERPTPGRVTIKGVDGTPDPRLGYDVQAFELDNSGSPVEELFTEILTGGFALHNMVVVTNGSTTVELRPGTYQIYGTRGPELSLSRELVTIPPTGEAQHVKLVIERQFDTPNALSADFHVHTARSFDSAAPLEARVAGFVGEGVDVIVSTDHEQVVDLGPVVSALGLEAVLATIVGQEATAGQPNPPLFDKGIGHINAWPLEVKPLEPGDGAIQKDYVATNMVMSRYRDAGAEVVQLNHPRTFGQGFVLLGVLDSIGYDPDLPIDSPPNDILLSRDITGASGIDNPDGFRNLDFDVMEVANRQDVGEYLAARRDWLSFLNQVNRTTIAGPVPFIPATGVSDSHHVTFEQNTEIGVSTGVPGYWRTYVRDVGDSASDFVEETFNAETKAGNMIATNGPYIEFRITAAGGSTADLGETLSTDEDEVSLEVTVKAANWIPVEEVRIIANGFVVMSFDELTTPPVKQPSVEPWSSSRDDVVRFSATLTASLPGDTYFLVEAGAKLSPTPAPPAFLGQIVPGAVPIAFTNPIFVDGDGGGFEPPGLPVMASATGSAEPRPAFAEVRQTNMPVHERIRRWWGSLLAHANSPVVRPVFEPVPSRLTTAHEHRGGCGHVHYALPPSYLEADPADRPALRRRERLP